MNAYKMKTQFISNLFNQFIFTSKEKERTSRRRINSESSVSSEEKESRPSKSDQSSSNVAEPESKDGEEKLDVEAPEPSSPVGKLKSRQSVNLMSFSTVKKKRPVFGRLSDGDESDDGEPHDPFVAPTSRPRRGRFESDSEDEADLPVAQSDKDLPDYETVSMVSSARATDGGSERNFVDDEDDYRSLWSADKGDVSRPDDDEDEEEKEDDDDAERKTVLMEKTAVADKTVAMSSSEAESEDEDGDDKKSGPEQPSAKRESSSESRSSSDIEISSGEIKNFVMDSILKS
jgi:hypothetical protein